MAQGAGDRYVIKQESNLIIMLRAIRVSFLINTANNNQYKLHKVLHKKILTWQCGDSFQSIIPTNAVNQIKHRHLENMQRI